MPNRQPRRTTAPVGVCNAGRKFIFAPRQSLMVEIDYLDQSIYFP